MVNDKHIKIEVAYGLTNQQILKSVFLPIDSTVLDAIESSNILNDFPELTKETLDVGIFSKRVSLDTKLTDNDRVEIYRPLTIDPKEARRLRAERSKNRSP